MKKLYVMIALIIVILMVGCSNKNDDQEKIASNNVDNIELEEALISKAEYPESVAFDDRDNKRLILSENVIDDEYKELLENFSYESASRILYEADKNKCYSPISLYMSLSLLASGASEESEEEMLDLLGIPNKEKLAKENAKMFRRLYKDNEIEKLKIVNSLWLSVDSIFHDDFINNAKENYYSSLFNVDFQEEITNDLMSAWVYDNTNEIISPKIETDSEQILAILNTLYFKNEWSDRFNKDANIIDKFYLTDDKEVECEYMNITYDARKFIRGDNFTSASLNLKGGSRMMFVLPDKEVSVDELVSSPKLLASMLTKESDNYGKVIFQVPKFSYDDNSKMKDMLIDMGMETPFEFGSQFKDISDGITYISNISQDTHISIDEKGVEAAAFTQIDLAGAMPPNENIAEMILDRPFIYVIYDRDVILFIGILNNPVI
ncbi:serpin family protein [Clostridiaceae bacterium HSG29]|nr:serpin family protein [Clostridiaceae bacterium HSG29]